MAVEDPYDRLKNLPPELVAKFKADRDRRLGEVAKKKDEFARTFKLRDSVHFSYRTPAGHIDPNSDVFTIAKWSDDYGNTVYVQKGSKEAYPAPDRIKARSERIQTQQVGFTALHPSEQSRIRTNFTSPGGRTDNRFSDYLGNEALAQQFQKLKIK